MDVKEVQCVCYYNTECEYYDSGLCKIKLRRKKHDI
jgi:hypothetical protein